MTDPPSQPLEPLSDAEVHVWLTCPEQTGDAGLLGRLERLMTEEERERRQRFRFARDQHNFLVTRALVRTVLSRYARIDPAAWRFVVEEHGRPEIAPELGSRLRFNLSHTRGLIACAVALDRSVGVDVEAIDRRTETTEIADHFFSTQEVSDLHALPTEQQRERFFTYWTLKESYIKARGLGLAIPLGDFSFHVRERRPIEISFAPGLEDDPARWQFFQQWLSERHSLAVAVPRTGRDLAVTVRRTLPLVE